MVAECINCGPEESTVVSGGNFQMLICIYSVSQIRYLLGSKVTECRLAKCFYCCYNSYAVPDAFS
jgi:hypothetical protein